MSRLLIPAFAAALAVGLSSLPGAPAPEAKKTSADWAQFRGPKRDNVSPDKNLLKAWPKGGPRVVWKGEGVGKGFSSVSVAGDKVFTMGGKDGSSQVFALDRAKGKVLWSSKVGGTGGNNGAGPRSTPTVDGKLVYALGQKGELMCLDIAKGEEQWRKNLPKDFGGREPYWSYCESPLVDGDRLICTPGGKKASMVALDKLTGKEVWRCAAGFDAGYSSIVISHAGGVKQYVQLSAAGTVGVAAKDGKLLWHYKKFAGNTANIPTAIVLRDQVLTTAGYGKGGALLTITEVDEKLNPREVYYNGNLTNKHGGVTIFGDSVYGDTDDRGRPFSADWKTGEIKWNRESEGKGRNSCAITYADGHLYCRYQNGIVALVPADATSYEEVGSFKIPNCKGPSWSHPVVIGGRLYLREQDIVWCYDVKAK